MESRIKFSAGDKVEYVTRKLNEDFLNHIKNVPTVVEEVVTDRSYKSGVAIKIPLHHHPIDSAYFKKIE